MTLNAEDQEMKQANFSILHFALNYISSTQRIGFGDLAPMVMIYVVEFMRDAGGDTCAQNLIDITQRAFDELKASEPMENARHHLDS